MEISFYGGNAVEFSTKNTTVIVDPKLSTIGLKDVTAKHAVYLGTQVGFIVEDDDAALITDRPGEYEVKEASIRGVAAKRRIELDDSTQATMYRVVLGGVSVAIVGHVMSPLTEDQLEALGTVDVLVVPVGDNGYTFDAHSAVEVVRQVDPRAVIPTHYATKGAKYEVIQDSVENFIKELGAPHEVMPKWKIKNGQMPDTLSIVQLEA